MDRTSSNVLISCKKRDVLRKCKRAITFLLVFAYLLTAAVPMISFASDTGPTVTGYYIENDGSVHVSVTIDGKMNEVQWFLDTPLVDTLGASPPAANAAFLWDLNHLYVYVSTSGASSLALSLNGFGVAYDIAANGFASNAYGCEGKADGGNVELKIPFSAFGITIDDFDLEFPFSLTAIGADGGSCGLAENTSIVLSRTAALFGDACNVRAGRGIAAANVSATTTGGYAGDRADTIGKAHPAQEGTYRFYDPSKGKAGSANRIYMGKLGNLTVPAVPNLYLNREFIFETTLRVDSMPFFGSTASFPAGFQIQLVGRNSGNNTLYLSLGRRSADSQELMVYPTYANNTAGVPIGKNVGESFTLTVKSDGNYGYTLLIDGVGIGHFPEAINKTSTASGSFLFNTYSSHPYVIQQTDDVIDVTVFDYRILSDHYDPEALLKNALDAYSFDTIRGENISADSVKYDLVLPQTFVTPPFNHTVPIVWSSSDEAVVSGSGAVTAGEQDRAVVLTATAIKGGASAQKVFYLVVPGKPPGVGDLTAYFVHEMTNFTVVTGKPSAATTTPVNITLDGKLSEQPWLARVRLPETSGVGAPDGLLDLLWSTDSLYLGMEFGSNARTLTVTVGGKTSAFDIASGSFTSNALNAAGAVSGSSLELSIPLSELGFSSIPYDQTVSFELTLESATGSAGTEEPVTLTFSPLMAVKGDNAASVSAAKGTALNTANTNYAGDSATTASRPVTAPAGKYLLYDDGTAGSRRTYLIFTNSTGFSPYDGVLLEQDITIASMPSCDGPDLTRSSFWIWPMGPIIDDAKRMATFRDRIQAVGDEGELYYIFSDRFAFVKKAVPLHKKVGETFRLGIYWDASENYATIYVDGRELHTLTGVQELGADASSVGYVYNTTTSVYPGEGPIEVHIDNIRVLSGKHGSDKTLPNALDTITFDTIKNGNASENQVTGNLSLPAVLPLPPTAETTPLIWSSSDESVISGSGQVSRPATSGKTVLLTVSASFEGRTESKVFTLFVPGLSAASRVSLIENDLDPYTGAAPAGVDRGATLDGGYNSVVYDLGEETAINEVCLVDSDSFSRITPSTLSLYVSDDNVNYRMIDGWSFLKLSNKYYFYNFTATGRYVKVHSHLDNLDNQADFQGSLQEMITAYQNDHLLGSSGAFAHTTQTTAANASGQEAFDSVYLYTLSQLGIAENALRSDKGDIRFVLSGRVLYHYWTGTAFAVRVPEIPALGSVSIDVHYGSATAENISDGEGVYEVQYGTRTLQTLMVTGEYKAYPTIATLPNGDLIAVSSNINAATRPQGAFAKRVSQDGGRTWSAPVPFLPVTASEPESLFYDEVTGKLFLFYHYGTGYKPNDIGSSNMRIYFTYSTDGGSTWAPSQAVDNPRNYFLSYTKPIKLSTYDGEGPGVDFVLPFGAQYDSTGSFCCSTAYSTDGGLTFTASSDSVILADIGVGLEGGTSEGTLYERSDGKLFMLVRNQRPEATYFAKAYSDDGGITWKDYAVDSSVYAPNTQPIFADYNGTPLLFWGGNNVQGGSSYQRFPFNVAYSSDDCESFIGIQDLYLYTSFAGVEKSANNVVNPHGVFFDYKGRDEAVFTWYNLLTEPVALHISGFSDLLYKNKGAFDSFESGNPKYEGWLSTGNLNVSSERASEGSHSLLLSGLGNASRSIPYFVNGSISMDLYFDSSAGGFDLELQSAYSGQLNKATPVSLHIDENGTVWFYGADSGRSLVSSGLTLASGWNRLNFKVDLASEYCGLSLDGGAYVSMPVAKEIGQYVCFVMLRSYPGTQVYIDRFIADCSTVDANPQPEESYEPSLDLIFPLESLSLMGSAKITGNVGTNATAENSLELAWSTRIEGALLLGPGTEWTQVIKSARPDAWANVTGAISNLDAPRAYLLPLFPASPDLTPKGDLSAGTKPKDPGEITGSGAYGSISVTKQLTVHVGDEDVHITVDSLSVTGSGSLVVNRTGTGRLILHVADKFTLSGSGRINHAGEPGGVVLYYAGSDTVNISGSTRFTGSLFARSADIALGGSGGLVGNIVTGGSAVTISGGATADMGAVYAPGATLNLDGSAGVQGAVVARGIQLSGNSRIVYSGLADEDFFSRLDWPKN